MLFVKKEHIKYYIYAFLLAMSLSEILSYGIWFDIIPAFGNATISNPTPFSTHITYNPFLAFTIYILLYYIIFSNSLEKKQKIIYSFFVITMSINMFITGGRAGQVMYCIMIVILAFQYFEKQIIKAMIVSLIVVPTILFIAYSSSNIFQTRVDLAISNVINYEENKNTSVGLRLTFAINSWDIIKKHPFIGVGTGDFKNKYEKINILNTPQLKPTENPHNMYVLELVQFGLLGLASLLFILFTQIKFAINSKNQLVHKIGLVLPLLFAVIMLSDTYLLGHYTTLLFILFSAILYKDYEDETTV
jgi:O-antigen ligase